MKLVRPTFTGDTCGGGGGATCDSGCFCGPDASKCVGCTCKGIPHGAGIFYCNSGGAPVTVKPDDLRAESDSILI